jgi:hypothetical protein
MGRAMDHWSEKDWRTPRFELFALPSRSADKAPRTPFRDRPWAPERVFTISGSPGRGVASSGRARTSMAERKSTYCRDTAH